MPHSIAISVDKPLLCNIFVGSGKGEREKRTGTCQWYSPCQVILSVAKNRV